MIKTLALMSGKGGSGKTTLALSISSMLSSCGIKVLMIDCDIYTNGATYFYEDKLNELGENGAKLSSFYDIITSQEIKEIEFTHINEYFDFLPSITQVTKYLIEKYNDDYRFFSIGQFLQIIKEAYDLVIFDCQAGYTDLLAKILPYTNINLFVMESDAISSSAIRSLYLKIGHLVNDKKIFQVFNKVTQEEYDIYSKISGGTVFTNIETVIFDWKIRKAFSISQIPDMENTSADYGIQIYNICKILFPYEKIQSKLKQFETVIHLKKKVEEEFELNNKIQNIKVNSKSSHSKNIMFFMSFFCAITSCLISALFSSVVLNLTPSHNDTPITLIILISLSIFLGFTFLIYAIDLRKGETKNRNIINEYSEQLDQVRNDISILKAKLSLKD